LKPLAESLLDLCQRAANTAPLPRVHHVYIPPANSNFSKSRKFGLVVLEDNSTGFFFNLLEPDNSTQLARLPTDTLELAQWFKHDTIHHRGLGLGAISAIAQWFFRRHGFMPDFAGNPMADFNFDDNDHVGMVGYFPALVRKLREKNIPLTVLELNEEYLETGDRFQVTLDPNALGSCNKVLCTASTIINDTVDEILASVAGAQHVALIGPSAGCFPDPLFERGVAVVGGSLVTDHKALEAHCEAETDWENSVIKYCLKPDTYPGFTALLEGPQAD